MQVGPGSCPGWGTAAVCDWWQKWPWGGQSDLTETDCAQTVTKGSLCCRDWTAIYFFLWLSPINVDVHFYKLFFMPFHACCRFPTWLWRNAYRKKKKKKDNKKGKNKNWGRDISNLQCRNRIIYLSDFSCRQMINIVQTTGFIAWYIIKVPCNSNVRR